MGVVDTTASANESTLQTQLKTEKWSMTTRHLSAEMMAKVSSENAVVKFGRSAGRNTECAVHCYPEPSTLASRSPSPNAGPSSNLSPQPTRTLAQHNQVCTLHCQGDDAQPARLRVGPPRMRGGQGQGGAGHERSEGQDEVGGLVSKPCSTDRIDRYPRTTRLAAVWLGHSLGQPSGPCACALHVRAHARELRAENENVSNVPLNRVA